MAGFEKGRVPWNKGTGKERQTAFTCKQCGTAFERKEYRWDKVPTYCTPSCQRTHQTETWTKLKNKPKLYWERDYANRASNLPDNSRWNPKIVRESQDSLN